MSKPEKLFTTEEVRKLVHKAFVEGGLYTYPADSMAHIFCKKNNLIKKP